MEDASATFLVCFSVNSNDQSDVRTRLVPPITDYEVAIPGVLWHIIDLALKDPVLEQSQPKKDPRKGSLALGCKLKQPRTYHRNMLCHNVSKTPRAR